MHSNLTDGLCLENQPHNRDSRDPPGRTLLHSAGNAVAIISYQSQIAYYIFLCSTKELQQFVQYNTYPLELFINDR